MMEQLTSNLESQNWTTTPFFKIKQIPNELKIRNVKNKTLKLVGKYLYNSAGKVK